MHDNTICQCRDVESANTLLHCSEAAAIGFAYDYRKLVNGICALQTKMLVAAERPTLNSGTTLNLQCCALGGLICKTQTWTRTN
jgi:hypothetical protein